MDMAVAGMNGPVSVPVSASHSSILGEDCQFVCAVSENRLREIGLATINIKAPEVFLATFVDSHTYVHLLTKLSLFCPKEVLLPKSCINSQLHRAIEVCLLNTEVKLIDRKYFNESNGAQLMEDIAIIGSATQETRNKYLCMGSLAALLKFIEYGSAGIIFAKNSLKITLGACDNTMMIDGNTLSKLEVVDNQKGARFKKHTLLGVVDHTCTAVGARMLRISLCQPPNDVATISTRLDCVDELLENENMYHSIRACLPAFGALDKLIANLVKLPRFAENSRNMSQEINSILSLKQILDHVNSLYQSLMGCQNELFIALRRNLDVSKAQSMEQTIAEIIQNDTTNTKSTLHMRMQQYFAVKAGINGLLDVARKTYSETIEEGHFGSDIHELHASLRQELDLPQLKLDFSARRGFHFTLSIVSPLPRSAIEIVKKGKSHKFSTVALSALNERQKESTEEIMLLTERVITELSHNIRKDMAFIYQLNDSVALLDLLVSFATYVTLNDAVCRPNFSDARGPIAIREGRHPILDQIQRGSRPFVPVILVPIAKNDCFIDNSSHFQVITGPNMVKSSSVAHPVDFCSLSSQFRKSGKSTFIRQVALLSILAHSGSYIPAQFCSMRPIDRLFSRIGSDDSIEESASSFMMEMRETAYIVQNVTPRSLVIVDELGRGTSISDGRALAWSICEDLIHKKACVLFTTHFRELSGLEALFPCVRNFHTSVSVKGDTIQFNYSMENGPVKLDSYGVSVAVESNLPADIIQDARNIVSLLQLREKQKQCNSRMSLLRTALELVQRIKNLKRSSLDTEGKMQYINQLKAYYFG